MPLNLDLELDDLTLLMEVTLAGLGSRGGVMQADLHQARLTTRGRLSGSAAVQRVLVCGAERRADGLSVQDLALTVAYLTPFELSLGESALRTGEGRLEALRLQAALSLAGTRPTSLTVPGLSLGQLDVRDLTLPLGAITLSADLLLRGLQATAPTGVERELEALADGLRLTRGRLSWDQGALQVASLELLEPRIRRRAGSPVQLTSGAASASKLSLQAGRVTVGAGSLEVSAITVADATVSSPHLTAHDLSLSLALPHEPAVDPAPSPAADPPLRLSDLAVLDTISARLVATITLDVTVPVLGRRQETHTLEVPVTDGLIDFRALERSLGFLKDAVFDFEVEPGKLILEKDLPLVPFDNTTLVSWPLSAEDQTLAEMGLVRLSTLARFERPTPPDDAPQATLTLHTLALADIALEMGVPGTMTLELHPQGQVRLGGADHPAVQGLTLAGALCHQTEEDPIAPEAPTARGERSASAPPSALQGSIEAVSAAVSDVQLGAVRLGIETLSLRGVQTLTLAFSGLRLARVEVDADTLEATGLTVQLGASAPASPCRHRAQESQRSA